MNYHRLACGVVRALRGKRSQLAFSRRLGYSTNVAYAWEAGRRGPSTREAFRMIAGSKNKDKGKDFKSC